MSARVTLQNLTLSYDRRPAVHHVSGIFEPGSLTAVTGPNGAGKSTLLKGIAGLLKPSGGSIRIDGAPRLAYLPQAPLLQDDFPISVSQMVAAGLWHEAGCFGALDASCRGRALQAIASVGLKGFEERQVGTLSCGQFQRALFARLLVQDAPLILLDEPLAAVDYDTTAGLLSIIRKWHAEGRTVICVLHDFDQIRAIFPRCLWLARERVEWGNTVDVLQPERLKQLAGFREAWQAEAEVCEQ